MIDPSLKQKTKADTLDPNIIQRRAADPLQPVWVGASAGTGKTKVLTDRVLRLLLPDQHGRVGTDPHRILCLTYTKAAAAEMKERITDTLRQWAVTADDKLKHILEHKLFGYPPTPQQFTAARNLFAAVVDVPGGLKIMTIHSFCSSTLARFPLEAGLYPGMEAMEESEANTLMRQALLQVIENMHDEGNAYGLDVLNRLLRLQNEEQLLSLIKNIFGERRQFLKLLADKGSFSQLSDEIYACLDVDPAISEDVLLQHFFEYIKAKQSDIYALIGALTAQSGKIQSSAGWALKDFVETGNQSFDDWCSIFLTQKQTVDTRLASITKKEPSVALFFDELTEKTLKTLAQIKAYRLAQQSHDVLFIGYTTWLAYDGLKKQQARLDYDDLISYTAQLLDNAVYSSRVQWVMYKLDGGIDHILVDEAQDTNPDQWEIIKHLCTEFFSGQGNDKIDDEDRPRTLFVVGDEKQSIYSFQRANPQQFKDMKAHFAARFDHVQLPMDVVPMDISFRTTQAVLDHVDVVMQNYFTKHMSFREGQAGHIEIWPLLKDGEKEKAENWRMPDKIIPAQNAAPVLAKKIASTIKGWLDEKRILEARNRPIEPRDVMILVRSRNALVRQIIRALKAENIPLSGADRMVLLDEIVVMDLMALMSFALQPNDSLTLATILKSPFIGMSEDALLECAYGRGKTALWQALKGKSAYKEIVAWLEKLLQLSGQALPFEFLNFVLTQPCPASKLSGREAIAKRLGQDVFEAVDELLSQALHFEQSHISTLQHFVQHLRAQNIEIKRETETGDNVVRIMTVHGAKGLQAPIVFLPDTVVTSHSYSRLERLLWPQKTALDVPLWAASKDDEVPLYAQQRDGLKEQQKEEYQRLLYVAMTRAEDELYICGKRGRNDPQPESWYSVAKEALKQLEGVEEQPFSLNADNEYCEEDNMLVLHRPRQAEPDRVETKLTTFDQANIKLPIWAYDMMPEEPNPPSPLTPSRPSEDEPAVLSPLAGQAQQRFKRGNITHALLQFLPDIPVDQREIAARNWLAKPAHAISTDIQESIASETLAILNDAAYAPLFGEGSLAEVPLSGLLGAQILSGQIDRLLITEKAVWIIDYKSNRPSPERIEDVPSVYFKQMRSYREALEKIYPDKDIKTYLLWTDGPRLMEVS